MDFEPRFRLTPLMMRQIKAIEECRGFLRAARLRQDWNELLHNEARVRDALASVRIEGNVLTWEAAFELAKGVIPKELTDHEREFLNYLSCFEAIDGLRGQKSYRASGHDLQNLQKIIVDGVRGGGRDAGRYRQTSVQIVDRAEGGGYDVRHDPPPSHEVEDHMRALVGWIERVKKYPSRAQLAKGHEDPWVHPVILAGIVQHRLVWIHPFIDGNGRSARMFTTLLLYQRGYDFKYLFNLSGYYDQNRENYYDALRSADAEGDYTPWLEYFLGGFSNQMFRIRRRACQLAIGLEAAAQDDEASGDGS
jgi:Fic family protein